MSVSERERSYMRRIGTIKRESHAEAQARHLALSLAERLERSWQLQTAYAASLERREDEPTAFYDRARARPLQPLKAMGSALAELAELLQRAGVPYALIGAHAVNAWLEPRATADVDVTVEAGASDHQRLRETLLAAGDRVGREHGAGLPSGPDFVRFVSPDDAVVLEVQAAKTSLQRELVARAQRATSGMRVATPEDLVVLKLIADRAKDRIDLIGREKGR